jgi:hypothetical protein
MLAVTRLTMQPNLRSICELLGKVPMEMPRDWLPNLLFR